MCKVENPDDSVNQRKQPEMLIRNCRKKEQPADYPQIKFWISVDFTYLCFEIIITLIKGTVPLP